MLRLTLGVVTGLLATLVYFGARGTGPDATGDPADYDPFLAEPLPAPPLDLTDSEGAPVTLERLRGRVAALFFGYTQCPDVCPITLAQLSRIQEELDPEGERLQIVFVSLDPVRDTAEVLERFTQSFHPGVIAATGEVESLRAQVLEYGIGFVYRPRAGGAADSVAPSPGGRLGDDYLVDHTARTFLIDEQGMLVAQVLPETSSDVLKRAIERVIDG
ncbi:SCO family protein [Gaopeijia maritima]